MESGQRIVVVDGISETEAVLKAVLEPKGLTVNRVRGDAAETGTMELRPHLLVLHGDLPADSTAAAPAWDEVPRIIIGTARLPDPPQGDRSDRRQYLQQPFQYSELIQAIERLLKGS